MLLLGGASMIEKFNRTITIGEIVAAFPQSSECFTHFKIDFYADITFRE